MPTRLFLFVALFLLPCSLSAQVCESTRFTPYPGGAHGIHLGTSVALDGDLLATGAPGWSIGFGATGCLTGVVEVRRRVAGEWTHETVLAPAVEDDEILFGRSVAISGNVIAVGAPFAGTYGFGRGFIFRGTPENGWVQEQEVVPISGNDFGTATALLDDVVVFGQTGIGQDSGQVFRRDAITGEWVGEAVLIPAGLSTFSDFAESIALIEDEIWFGAPGQDDGFDEGAVYIFRRDPATGLWSEVDKLTPPVPAPDSSFGESVSVRGDVAIVGAPDYDGTSASQGAAFVYRRDPISSEWVFAEQITGAVMPPGFSVSLGTSVSIDGNFAAIGARSNAGMLFNVGTGFLYSYDPVSSSWSPDASFFSPEQFHGDFMGSSTAIDGATALFGAPGVRLNSVLDAGTVTIAEQDVGGDWIQTDAVWLSDGTARDRLGSSVDLDGPLAIAGAPGNRHLPDPGAAYIYRFDPSTGEWTEDQRLEPESNGEAHLFGDSVGISGEFAVVAGPLHDAIGEDSGSVRVYRYDSLLEEWTETQTLTASDGGLFASSLAIRGNSLVIGGAGSFPTSRVFSYRWDALASLWIEEQIVTPAGSAPGEQFGASVALNESMLVVGAPYDDGATEGSGAMYIFERDPVSGLWVQTDRLFASDGQAGDEFGARVSASGEFAWAGATLHDGSVENSGAVYIYRRNSVTGSWSEHQKLTASPEISFNRFGSHFDVRGDQAALRYSLGFPLEGGLERYRWDAAVDRWVKVGELIASGLASGDSFGSGVALHGEHLIAGAIGDDAGCLPTICDGCLSGAVHFLSPDSCTPDPKFVRGDANGDSVVDIADPLFTLNYLFSGGSALCLDAQDANDDGSVDVADSVHGLNYLFGPLSQPVQPFPNCGEDLTPDLLPGYCTDSNCP